MKSELPFTAKDICSIITSCGKAGVQHLELGDLKLDFGLSQPEQTAFQIVENKPEVLSRIESEEDYKALLKDNVDIGEDEINHAMITNPELWEDMIAGDELTHGRGSNVNG